MKKTTFTLLAVILILQTKAQFVQNAFSLGGTGYDGITSVIPDPNNGWIVSGYFQNSIDLDPGEATYTLTATPGTYGRFICKYNINFQPTQSVVFPAAMAITNLSIDANNNIYASGSLGGNLQVDANPGAGQYFLQPEGGGDAFVCKLNPDFEFLWATSIGGNSGEGLKEMSISADGNIVLAMNTTSIIELNTINGLETFDASMSFGIPFVVSLDTDGVIQWGALFTGTPYLSTLQPMGLDSQGNIYITGSFEYTMDADPGESVYTIALDEQGWDNFIVKLNPSGDLVWAYAFGNPPYDSDYAFNVEVSPTDVISIAGGGQGQFDIDPTEGEYLLTNTQGCGYVLNLTSDGEFIDVWEFFGSGYLNLIISEIHYDNAGNCYCVLPCTSNCDLNPGEESLPAIGTYIVKMGPDGNFVSSYSLPAQGINVAEIYTDENDNMIINGTIYSTTGATFQTVNGDVPLANNGIEDLYILAAAPCENSGCLDNTACNYNPDALCDSGNCIYSEPTDFDCNGAVGVSDLLEMISEFGCLSNCGDLDIDQDGLVGANDLIILLGEM